MGMRITPQPPREGCPAVRPDTQHARVRHGCTCPAAKRRRKTSTTK